MTSPRLPSAQPWHRCHGGQRPRRIRRAEGIGLRDGEELGQAHVDSPTSGPGPTDPTLTLKSRIYGNGVGPLKSERLSIFEEAIW